MASLSEGSLLDWQQVVDEVQALEAIYGDDFRILEASVVLPDGAALAAENGDSGSSSGSSRAPPDAAALAGLDAPASDDWALDCTLMVRMEPPAGSLRLQLAQETEADAAGPSSSGGRAAGYAVQFLPPICMQLRLAAGYPSQHPPGVSLSALWLTAAAAAQLEGQLQQLWVEQGPGAPVCYTWADWLQSSALQHLGAAEALVLGARPASSWQEGRQQQYEPSSSGGEQQPGGSGGGGSSSGGEGGPLADQGAAEDVLMKMLRCAGRRGLNVAGL